MNISCSLCLCPHHDACNPLVERLSGDRLQTILAHKFCHYPPLRLPQNAGAIWPACCARSLAALTCRVNETAPAGAHFVEARAVRYLVRLINDAAQAALAADAAANPLRAGFNGEGALLDLWLCFHNEISEVENYRSNGARVFSGVQVKAATIPVGGGQLAFGNCDGYSAHVLCLLSFEVPLAGGGVEYVFMLMNGQELEQAAGVAAPRNIGLTAAQRQIITSGNTLRKLHGNVNPGGTALKKSNDAAVVQRFTQHLQQAAGVPGAQQSYYAVSSPRSPQQLTPYRAWVHLWLVYLQPLGFHFASPHVDMTHCDILLQWPGESEWWRVEHLTMGDKRPGQFSYAAYSGRGGNNNPNHSGDFDAMLIMHQVAVAGHPQQAHLPPNTGDMFFIPVREFVDNDWVRMDADWVHPQYGPMQRAPTMAFGKAHRITVPQQLLRAARANCTLYFTIERPANPNRRRYNDPAITFPTRSVHRTSDWARKFLLSLASEPPPFLTLAQRMRLFRQ